MNAVSNETILAGLHWRYAVKKFDASKKIPADVWSVLEESLRLAPSSYGLQPWKFFVVDNPETRAKLLPHSWGQTQVVEASHLVVLALKLNVGPADADRLIAEISKVRGVPESALEGYRGMMTNSLKGKPQEAIDVWMTNQIYIALGQLLTTAAMLGVDACPMEGFVPPKYDEVLGLTAKGYKSIVVATLGTRAPDDAYALLKKVRYPAVEMVEHL